METNRNLLYLSRGEEIRAAYGYGKNKKNGRAIDKFTKVLSLTNIAYNQARSQLPRVPADRPLEKTATSVATRHAVMLPRGLVPADLAQSLPASVLLHLRRICLCNENRLHRRHRTRFYFCCLLLTYKVTRTFRVSHKNQRQLNVDLFELLNTLKKQRFDYMDLLDGAFSCGVVS